jgi:hypothetical protein
MSCLYKGIVKLEYLLTELIVILVYVLDLADSVSDCPPDFRSFLLGIFILATGLYKLLPKVVNLFLKKRSIWPFLIIGVAIYSLPSIVVLG